MLGLNQDPVQQLWTGSPPSRSPRRAYDPDGREIPPMTLGNMREHGARSVRAYCRETNCGHSPIDLARGRGENSAL